MALEVPASSKGLAQFEADLARINVLRLRGNIQTAKNLCAELLVQRPDFAQAQALMGDLCVDSGEFVKAADWYEMAAANSEDSPTLLRRAAQARQRVDEVEALAATKRLGIPTSRSKLNLMAGLLLAMVLTACGLAYFIGGKLSAHEPVLTIREPLTLSPAPDQGKKAVSPPKPSFSLPLGDELTLNALRNSILGARVLLAYRDPRGPTLVATLEAPPGEFTTTDLAIDAGQCLRDNAELERVVIRYLRNGETLAIATLSRKSFDSALSANRDLGTALEDVWPVLQGESAAGTRGSETQGHSGESNKWPATESGSGP